MLRKFLNVIAYTTLAAASVAATAPASAATTISFTGTSGTDGTDGNIRLFSNLGISVQASAWSLDGTTLERAWLGAYSSGLGVTNNDEGTGQASNSHTIDNVGQKDFILLVFSQSVNISGGVLNPYDVSATQNDNDARISYAAQSGAFTSPTFTPISLGSPVWASLAANAYNVSGNMTSPYNTSFASSGHFGNVWLVGAASPNLDQNDDGFKLKSITVTSAVPEPGTWLMMLFGFGLIGISLRRRNGRALQLAS